MFKRYKITKRQEKEIEVLFPELDELGKSVQQEIVYWLQRGEIQYLGVTYRLKPMFSIKEKVSKGISYSPLEMQDLLGLRITIAMNRDVQKVCAK